LSLIFASRRIHTVSRQYYQFITAPANIDIDHVRRTMSDVTGVTDVHDLHVWSLTSGVNTLSAHIVRDATVAHEELLSRVRAAVWTSFPIAHVTLQIESTKCPKGETHE
jgi:cobalt-zinc-cadmium efflux system protein